MDIESFDYHLPESLIAQTPLKNRDESRLLVLGRKTGDIEHKYFKNVIDYLQAGDTLVLNDTRVMPARLFGLKEETGAKVEMLMLTQLEDDDWQVLLKPAKRIKTGELENKFHIQYAIMILNKLQRDLNVVNLLFSDSSKKKLS